MSLPIDILPQARADLAEHAAFLGQGNPAIAVRFVRAARETFEFLADFPGVGVLYAPDDETIPAVRKWSVRGFPKYLVFYRNEGRALEIVRVIHGARDVPNTLRGS